MADSKQVASSASASYPTAKAINTALCAVESRSKASTQPLEKSFSSRLKHATHPPQLIPHSRQLIALRADRPEIWNSPPPLVVDFLLIASRVRPAS